MPRRLSALIAAVAMLAVVGCNSAPAAPPLTDPKEILVRTVAALQEIKSATIKGTFAGSINAEEMGQIDLSSVKLDVSLDVPGKKARVQLDAPTFMGTKADIIVPADGFVYMKILGPFAAFVGAPTTGKYMKTSAGEGAVPDEATDPTQALNELRSGLDKLPKPPEKLADERCGDQDCYHVRIALTAADLAAMGQDASGFTGDMTFDVWTRKNDLRPGKVGFSVNAGAQGTVSGTFEFTFDQGVNITAPPADQVTG
jgi:hypothetical protein